MRKFLPILIPIGLFLLIKLPNIGIRFSDSNIYFYTGYQLLMGKMLYKDIFFTNFPLLAYISAFYFLLLNKSLLLFYITPLLEATGVGYVIYLIVYKNTRNILLGVTSSLLYLFSFVVLSTSDHQTGVFLASLFSVLSFYLSLERKPVLAGIFMALTLLTKAYFFPIFLVFVIMLILNREKKTLYFFAAFFITFFIILLPSIVFSGKNFFTDVFYYSLTRSEGVSKIGVLSFFIQHDPFLVVLLICNIFLLRRYPFFGLLSLFSLLFVFFYQDIYYLYLNFIIPFLCISYSNFYFFLTEKLSLQKFLLPTIITILLTINLIIYLNSYRNLQKLANISQVSAAIIHAHPSVLYGSNDITPALSYLTNIPLLDGIIDTNENIFNKGFLDRKTLTKLAIAQHALIVAHGAYYPEASIQIDVTDQIFDLSLLRKSCSLLASYPIYTEGSDNRLNLLKCK